MEVTHHAWFLSSPLIAHPPFSREWFSLSHFFRNPCLKVNFQDAQARTLSWSPFFPVTGPILHMRKKTVLKWLAGVYIMTKWPGWGLRPETSNLYTHLQKKDRESQPHLWMKSDASWSQWTFCWYLPRRAPPQTTCWGFQVSPNLILKWLRDPISVQYFMLVTSRMLVEYNCRRQPMMFLLTVPWLRTSCIYLHVTWLGLEEKAQQMQLPSTRLFSRYLEREPRGHQALSCTRIYTSTTAGLIYFSCPTELIWAETMALLWALCHQELI